MKENQELMDSIAYCGLICKLCFQRDHCDGCKSENNNCERNLSDEGCYQKECSTKKGFDGCYQCDSIESCNEGIYSLGNLSKIKAFAICMKEDGKENFITSVLRNAEGGLSVEKGRDYDGKTIEEVLKMLRSNHESL